MRVGILLPLLGKALPLTVDVTITGKVDRISGDFSFETTQLKKG